MGEGGRLVGFEGMSNANCITPPPPAYCFFISEFHPTPPPKSHQPPLPISLTFSPVRCSLSSLSSFYKKHHKSKWLMKKKYFFNTCLWIYKHNKPAKRKSSHIWVFNKPCDLPVVCLAVVCDSRRLSVYRLPFHPVNSFDSQQPTNQPTKQSYSYQYCFSCNVPLYCNTKQTLTTCSLYRELPATEKHENLQI